jgi:DNA-binding NtrC family response regulator
MERFRILVVDDELLIRDLLYDFFITEGWDIVVAENGQKAIDYLRNQKFDIVLTDIRMPDVSGLDLTDRIRALYGDLPIVIMTGYPSLETAVAALRHKVDDYIIKPFNINQLYRTIKKTVEDRRQAAEVGTG